MYFTDGILSVEMLEEQVEIVTGQGVGIFCGGGLRFLTATQREYLMHLAVLGLDEFVLDPI
jgi:hypothetical protein